MNINRRRFLGALAAIGVLPAVKAEELAAAENLDELWPHFAPPRPSLLPVGPPVHKNCRCMLSDIELTPIAMSMEREEVQLTPSYDGYVAAQVVGAPTLQLTAGIPDNNRDLQKLEAIFESAIMVPFSYRLRPGGDEWVFADVLIESVSHYTGWSDSTLKLGLRALGSITQATLTRDAYHWRNV